MLQPNSDPHGGLKPRSSPPQMQAPVLQPNSDPHGGLKQHAPERCRTRQKASTKQRSARRIETHRPQASRPSPRRLQPNSDPHGGLKQRLHNSIFRTIPLQPNSDPHGGLKLVSVSLWTTLVRLQPNSDPHGGLKQSRAMCRTRVGVFNQTAIRTAD